MNCHFLLEKGSRSCRRRHDEKSLYCWQHQPEEKKGGNLTKDRNWAESIIARSDVPRNELQRASLFFPTRLFWQCDTHPGMGLFKISWIDLDTKKVSCPYDKTRTRINSYVDRTLFSLLKEIATTHARNETQTETETKTTTTGTIPNPTPKTSWFWSCFNGVALPHTDGLSSLLIAPPGSVPSSFRRREIVVEELELKQGSVLDVVLPGYVNPRKDFRWTYHSDSLGRTLASPSSALPNEKMSFTVRDVPEKGTILSLVLVYEDESVWAPNKHRTHVYKVHVTSPDIRVSRWMH